MTSKLSRQDVLDILEIVERSNFDEMHIEMEDFKISLVKSGAGSTVQTVKANATPVVEPPSSAPATQHASSTPPAVAHDPNLLDVLAPMLGVFFRAPKPGAAPYVQVGSRITPESVIGIIEVMKFMNAVPAGVSGEVVEIIAPDGQLVEFGQVLLRVRRDTL